jgi:hypothetical protein
MSRRRDEDLGALGQMPGFQYWNDLVSVSMSLMEQQMMRWTGAWQRVALGEETPGGMVRDLAGLWRGWVSMMTGFAAFPAEWSARRLMSTPSLVFTVDQAGQTVQPQSALTAITASGLEVGATDLQHVGTPACVPSSSVEVLLLDRGNRVQVTLVNLGRDAGAAGNNLAPGLYMGVAYAYERPNLRPLALVYLFVYRNV